MSHFSNNLGMWVSDSGLYFNSKEDADAADASGATKTTTYDDTDTPILQGGQGTAKAPVTATPDPIASKSAQLMSQGYTDLDGDGVVTDKDVKLATVPYGTPSSDGGTATTHLALTQPDGSVTDINDPKTITIYQKAWDAKRQNLEDRLTSVNTDIANGTSPKGINPQQYVAALQKQLNALGDRPGGGTPGSYADGSSSGGGSGAPGGATGPNGDALSGDTYANTAQGASNAGAAAGADASGQSPADHIQANTDTNNSLWADARSNYDKLGSDFSSSDESRNDQKEGEAMQKDLLQRLLNFDPQQYAFQFSDQALARQVALARSGGSAATQQANTFSAFDQAPALYAQGQSQADALANQRYTQAEQAAQGFGSLATATRSQDQNQSQFEATLSKSIADSVSTLTSGQVQMNEHDSDRFAQVWLTFAQLQQTYDKMSADEQVQWWDEQMKQQGLDNQWSEFKQSLKAQGKITAKDIIGGVFQLGGAVISGGASILAAKVAAEVKAGT